MKPLAWTMLALTLTAPVVGASELGSLIVLPVAGSVLVPPSQYLGVSSRAARTGSPVDQPNYEPFTPERKQICGVLLHPEGKRYGDQVNDSRQSGWGEGSSRDFQHTAPFIALASDSPFAETIRQGIEQGYASRKPPAEIAALWPQLIKRTELGDNDAGVRLSYGNTTQRTGMLERIRHYPQHTYRQLMRLDADFAAAGALHSYVRSTFGLSAAEFERIAANVKSSAAILRQSCRAGRLRFDADPEALPRDGRVPSATLDCDKP